MPPNLIRHVNERNERTTRNSERIVNFVFAVLLGIVGAMLLVHWLTPCAEGVLC